MIGGTCVEVLSFLTVNVDIELEMLVVTSTMLDVFMGSFVKDCVGFVAGLGLVTPIVVPTVDDGLVLSVVIVTYSGLVVVLVTLVGFDLVVVDCRGLDVVVLLVVVVILAVVGLEVVVSIVDFVVVFVVDQEVVVFVVDTSCGFFVVVFF